MLQATVFTRTPFLHLLAPRHPTPLASTPLTFSCPKSFSLDALDASLPLLSLPSLSLQTFRYLQKPFEPFELLSSLQTFPKPAKQQNLTILLIVLRACFCSKRCLNYPLKSRIRFVTKFSTATGIRCDMPGLCQLSLSVSSLCQLALSASTLSALSVSSLSVSSCPHPRCTLDFNDQL